MIDPSAERTPSVADVCLVLVTYRPDGDLPRRIERIRPQVGGAVIVDNGSHSSALSMLGELSTESLTVVLNQSNLGIARAFNIGVRHALDRKFAWAVLLDQDTEADPDMVRQLLAVHAAANSAFPEYGRVAIVGAGFRDTHARPDETRVMDRAADSWREVESVISSGSLLSLDAYTRIGPFRDEFFIDHVDTEYCFRARRQGFRIVQTRRALMSHTVGAPTRHTLLGPGHWTTNHSADRRYYIARNNTALLKEYGAHGRASWRVKSVARSLRLCKRIALYEDDKLAKIRAVAEGWWDGVRGNFGPRRQ